MSDFDLILRGGAVVTEVGTTAADIGIADGTIAAIGPQLAGTTDAEIDASHLHLFPGIIDAHVHFNEPGRADWEGIETGARALAAGGGTLFFDMPLNAHPPTLERESFRQKLAAAEKKSVTDFALWGGLVPQNLDHLPELAECGVVGFKAFMCGSGSDDFPAVDERTLREGMKRAARLRLPVAVHAESDRLTRELARERVAAGKTSVRDYLESRPVRAELDALRRAIELAGETACALHIVHVSCGEGIGLVTEARRRGLDVSCETCPHYLVLGVEDLERIGATAKCAPPLRNFAERDLLWRRLLEGEVHTVGSDHSPSPPGMKAGTDFFKIWGGISGVQHTLPLLLTEGHFNRGAALSLLSSMLASRVAERFRLPSNQGRIAAGAEANLALVDLRETVEVKTADLFYRHPQTPYAGRRLRGKVARTLLRGQTIFKDGKITARTCGVLVKPSL